MNKIGILVITLTAIIIGSMSLTAIPVGTHAAAQYSPELTGTAKTANLTIYANGSWFDNGTWNDASLVHVSGNNYSILNSITGNLTLMDSGIIVYGNGNSVNGNSGIMITNVTDITISDFGYSNGSSKNYLSANYSSGVTITGSEIGNTALSTCHVSVDNVGNFVVRNSNMEYVGFIIQNTGNVTFIGNLITETQIGVNYAENENVSGNTFKGAGSYFNSYEVTQFTLKGDNGIGLSGGPGPQGFVLDQVSSVTIENVNLQWTSGSNPTLSINQANYLKIHNVTLNYFSIVIIDYTNSVDISDLNAFNLTTGSYGVELWYDGTVSVVNSTFTARIGGSLWDFFTVWEINKLYLSNNTFNTTSSNSVGYGMDLEDIGFLTMQNSSIYFHSASGAHAFYTYEVGNGTIEGNTIYVLGSGDYGMYIDEHSIVNISNNHLYSGNGSQTAIYLEYLSQTTIQDNYFGSFNGSYNFTLGVYLYYTVDVKVVNNVFLGPIFHGMYDSYGVGDSIVGNSLGDSAYAIQLNHAASDNVSSNTGTSSSIPITLNYSTGNMLWNNVFINLGIAGISSYHSNSNTYASNTLTKIDQSSLSSGVEILYSSGETYTGNNVTGFAVGINMKSAQGENFLSNVFQAGNLSVLTQVANDILMTGNTFSHYNYLFRNAGGLSNSQIYHNNFMDYNATFGTNSSSNLSNVNFDLGSAVGGNYWSNYSGSFTNGIGNTPYALGLGMKDNYPLERPWTSPTVTFIENGLPAGATWSIQLGSSTYTSSVSSISIPITNGSYGYMYYTVGPVAGYYRDASSGTIYYSGHTVTSFVNFETYKYSVSVTATGLPASTTVGITISNSVYQLNQNMKLMLANGTYAYSVEVPSGYSTATTSGDITVNGHGTTLTITFTAIPAQLYTVSFVEDGLSGSFTWGVNVSNTLHGNSSTDSITMHIAAGTYNFSVKAPAGYTYHGSGYLLVSGNVTVLLYFSANSSHSGSPTGYSLGTVGLALIGGAGIGIAAILLIPYGLPPAKTFINNIRNKWKKE